MKNYLLSLRCKWFFRILQQMIGATKTFYQQHNFVPEGVSALALWLVYMYKIIKIQ